MKILSIVFFVVGGLLAISAINLITIKGATEGFAYQAGTFIPALFCLAIGWFLSKKVKPKETI